MKSECASCCLRDEFDSQPLSCNRLHDQSYSLSGVFLARRVLLHDQYLDIIGGGCTYLNVLRGIFVMVHAEKNKFTNALNS